MPKITLSMIVKNEEKYLSECLESVKDIIDEIVIVDTGSCDKTISIAEEFNAKVFHFKWNNDFSAARNYALSKSTGNWILYLDADERLPGKSLDELKLITSNNESVGYRCSVNSINEINGRSNFMRYTRLFYNSPQIKFNGRVHEQIDDSLIENGYKILDSDIEIIHIGYNVDELELKSKANRNLELLRREFEKNKSPYTAYQIANTYTALEEFDKAQKYYKVSVIENSLNKEYKAFAYLNLSGYAYKKQKLNEALEFLDKGLKEDSSNPLLNLLASEVYFRLNKFDESFKYCKSALIENKAILSGNNKTAMAIGLKNDIVICKGIYYSVLASNKIELNNFLGLLKNDNEKLYLVVKKIIENLKLTRQESDEIIKMVSNDNLDLFLVLLENFDDKHTSLEILKKIYNSFRNNSKFLKSIGLLYFENNFLNEAANFFEESLLLKEKDPASVFFLISVYLQDNRLEKIPGLLIMAEREFGNIPEFNSKFEILKQKLSAIFEK